MRRCGVSGAAALQSASYLRPAPAAILPDRDDGKVTVESTRVEGMNDHLELPVNHVFMMRDPEVIAQVVHYLDHGSFFRGVN